ncbi:septum formation initiator family protein [Pseudooceanicola sediminis]|uniref:Septum formation initiator family protein n=1 Tax=Pseudooceanicola sediminis TaxID=2211117 RepID=A0A399J303_9RHOB|nr:septum formation initiator family protein [Pseudooceanicola sediminis]KAA2317397.1 septum formation initiator family protein [Puniceibacterium sp. HSS470]RII39813.1 septum formation initiator family protein [Pseudooceanicola sediminis]|tara:strand:+ start:21676 stop:21975 length:300 start_codon:yes stop_codon:yes gene_type:complete
MISDSRPPFGLFLYFAAVLMLGMYFTFAAVQGEYGLFKRAVVQADNTRLQSQLDALKGQISVMENRTRRLSDGYLDLDLLDQQARDVLGLVRGDEFVLR